MKKEWVLVVFFAGQVCARSISPGGVITDRPSSEQLPIPPVAPTKPTSGFELPPVPKKKQTLSSKAEALLQVKEFIFSGNTVFSESELQAIAKPFTNKPIGASDLEDLRKRLTHYYIDHGYINSGAILPPQNVQDGIVKFQIIEGELSEIRISGTEWLSPDYIRDRLQLAAGPPLNNQSLQERYQLLLTDPLIERMDGRLMPGSNPGESILDVNVIRAKPYGLSASVDNYRPPSIGAEEGRLDGWLRNITGLGDFWNVSLGFGADRVNVDARVSVPLNRYDTLLSFYYTNRRSTIQEAPLDELDIDNRFEAFELTLFQPVYRTLQQQVNVGARIAVRESKNFLLGRPFSFSLGEEQGVSKVTALRLTQEFIDSRLEQVFFMRSTFSVGLDVFDATWHDDNRPDGDYFAWLGQMQYTRQVMDNGAQLRLRGNVQVSNDALLPLEQYAVGGMFSVRGYRENELVRDQGYNVSLEFHYPLVGHGLAEYIPGHLVLVPFLDYGGAWNKGDSDNLQHLLGIGAGLVWSFNRFNAELFYGHDLIDAADQAEYDLQDASLYFRVSALLF